MLNTDGGRQDASTSKAAPSVRSSLHAIASRYGAEDKAAWALYQHFLPQAKVYIAASGGRLKHAPEKLAIQQVVRELSKLDLGDLCLENYFDRGNSGLATTHTAAALATPASKHNTCATALDGFENSDQFNPVLERLEDRYKVLLDDISGYGNQLATHGLIKYLFRSLCEFKTQCGHGSTPVAEIIDELLMMLSFAVGDLPPYSSQSAIDEKQ